MTQSTTIEKVGQRLYLANLPFGAKDRAKFELGLTGKNWDPDRRQWWCGAAKRVAAEKLVAELNGADGGMDLRDPVARGARADQLEEAGDTEAAAKLREPVPQEDPHRVRLTGKGTYKGRTYYIGARTKDGTRVRLLSLPDAVGKYLDFWADAQAVTVTKTYQLREVWDGRRYSGRTRTEYTTLGSIADFLRRQQDPAQRRGQCTECGTWGPSGEPCRECGGEGTHG